MKKAILLAVLLAMLLVSTASAALAQIEPVGEVGFITSISEGTVLVEEDPQDPVFGGIGSGKGYFTVTGETGIFGLLGGDAVVPASFEDLEVGQLVAATYAGPILESYPSQGEAGSITILSDLSGDEPACVIPEGCDSDGVPVSTVQYDNAS